MAITIGSTRKARRGQAMVEFALVLTIAVIVLFVSVQFALIGQLYLALGQMNYRGVRYAAVSPDCIDPTSPCGLSSESITQYMLSVASPTIVNLTNKNANALNVTIVPLGTKRFQGDTVEIDCRLDITGALLMPKFPLSFPTQLSSKEKAFTE